MSAVAKLQRAQRLLAGGVSPGIVAEHVDLDRRLIVSLARGEFRIGECVTDRPPPEPGAA